MPAEINIPVRVQVLKDSLNELQGLLSNLRIDSNSFKTVDKYIKDMTKEMASFEAMMSRPFSSQSQFNKANNSIEKMETTLAKARIAMNDVKFPEIKLSESQQSQWDNLNKTLDDAIQKFEEVKAKVKGNILSDVNVSQMFEGMDSKYMTKSFDELFTMIDRKTQQLGRKMADAKEKMAEFNGTKGAKSRRINSLLTNGITPESIGQVAFDKFFTAGKNGATIFKTPGAGESPMKTQFMEFLQKQFTLEDNDIAQLKTAMGKGGVAQLNRVLTNMGSDNMFSRALSRSTFKDENNLQQKVQDAVAAYTEYEAVLQKFRDAADLGGDGKAAGEVGAAGNILAEKKALYDQARQALMDTITQQFKGDSFKEAALSKYQSTLNQFKTTLKETNLEYTKLEHTQRTFTNMKMAISNFMGFYQVLNLTKRAVRDAMTHIKDLDSVMNKISIVTDMSTGDLWQQVDAYSQMAQKYGVSIKGAYEVSQIYYQQGLNQKEVLELTNETLKLSKVSGLDYATTTDYMTTAIRGFKMEATDASRVVDVYSNLAAHTAVSQGELAVGMSKTASSLESVGASFEESSAMISTMVAVTRESATNIGSAMKSIASRYGEMKKDISALVDEEGEALSYNKVDAALQSVGISLKDSEGQFRNITDVIIELGEKWDTLDSIQQRYIATQFAGNRQQSRFLALVSNVDLLKSNLNYALDSEDTSDIQALKALDSIESRTEQLKVAYQQMYTTIGAEDVWKGALGGLTEFMNTLNGLPKLFGTIPVGAMTMIYDVVNVFKTLGSHALNGISKFILGTLPIDEVAAAGRQVRDAYQRALEEETPENRLINKKIGKETSNEISEAAKAAQQDRMQPASTPTAAKNAVKEAQEISKEAEKQNQVNIETNLSTADLAAQGQAATEQAKAAMEANRPVLNIEADGSKAASVIEELISKVETANPTLHINADTSNIHIDGLNNNNNPTGPAQAAGNQQTLMGELGPELYVANGRYYIAGANGPEMVGLPSDAIVFNHLQTQDLLKNQKTTTTGKPVTNERKATAMAAGNISEEILALLSSEVSPELLAQISGILAADKDYTDSEEYQRAKRNEEYYLKELEKFKQTPDYQHFIPGGEGARVDSAGLTHALHTWNDGRIEPLADFERARAAAPQEVQDYITDKLFYNMGRRSKSLEDYDSTIREQGDKILSIPDPTQLWRDLGWFGPTNIGRGTRSIESAIADLAQWGGNRAPSQIGMIGEEGLRVLQGRPLTDEIRQQLVDKMGQSQQPVEPVTPQIESSFVSMENQIIRSLTDFVENPDNSTLEGWNPLTGLDLSKISTDDLDTLQRFLLDNSQYSIFGRGSQSGYYGRLLAIEDQEKEAKQTIIDNFTQKQQALTSKKESLLHTPPKEYTDTRDQMLASSGLLLSNEERETLSQQAASTQESLSTLTQERERLESERDAQVDARFANETDYDTYLAGERKAFWDAHGGYQTQQEIEDAIWNESVQYQEMRAAERKKLGIFKSKKDFDADTQAGIIAIARKGQRLKDQWSTDEREFRGRSKQREQNYTGWRKEQKEKIQQETNASYSDRLDPLKQQISDKTTELEGIQKQLNASPEELISQLPQEQQDQLLALRKSTGWQDSIDAIDQQLESNIQERDQALSDLKETTEGRYDQLYDLKETLRQEDNPIHASMTTASATIQEELDRRHQQEEEQKQQEEEARLKAEEQRQQEEARKAEEEAKAKADEEARRQAEEAAAEKKRLAEEEARKAAEESKKSTDKDVSTSEEKLQQRINEQAAQNVDPNALSSITSNLSPELAAHNQQQLEHLDQQSQELIRQQQVAQQFRQEQEQRTNGTTAGFNSWGANRFAQAQEQGQVANLNPSLFQIGEHVPPLPDPTATSPMLQHYLDAHPEVREREEAARIEAEKAHDASVANVRNQLNNMDATGSSVSSDRDFYHEGQSRPEDLDPVAMLRQLQQQQASTSVANEVQQVSTVPPSPPSPPSTEAATQPSGQLKFDLDNLGPENTITVPIEPVAPETSAIQETIEQAEGQISMDEILSNLSSGETVQTDIEFKPNAQEAEEKKEELGQPIEAPVDFKSETDSNAEPPSVEAAVQPSGQLKFDLDNLGPENTITVPIEPVAPEAPAIQEAVKQVNGQISMDDIPLEQAKLLSQQHMHSWDDLNNAFNNTNSGQSLNVNNTDANQQLDETKERAEQTRKEVERPMKISADTSKAESAWDKFKQKMTYKGDTKLGGQLSGWGSGLNMLAGMIKSADSAANSLKGSLMAIAGAMKIVGGIMSGSPIAIVTGIMAMINAIDTLVEDDSERLERLNKEAEELQNKAKESKADLKTLQNGSKKLDELKEKRYESAEAADNYQNAVDDLAGRFPELISGFNEAGDAIIEASNMEIVLANARERTAQATYDAAEAEQKAAQEAEDQAREATTKKLNEVSTALKAQVAESLEPQVVRGTVADMIPAETEEDIQKRTNLIEMYQNAGLGNPFNNEYQGGYTKEGFISSLQSMAFQNTREGQGGFSKKAYDWIQASKTEKWLPQEFGAEFIKQLQSYDSLTSWEQTILDVYNAFTQYDQTSDLASIDTKNIQNSDLLAIISKMQQAVNIGDEKSARTAYSELKVLQNTLGQQFKELTEDGTLTGEDKDERAKELQQLSDQINEVAKSYQEWMSKKAVTSSKNKRAATSYINGKFNDLDFMTDETGLISILGANVAEQYEQMVAEMLKQGESYKWEDYIADTSISSNIDSVALATEEFWDDLTTYGTIKSDKFINMIKNIDEYHKDDFQEFSDIKNWDIVSEQIFQAIGRRYENIQTNLEDFIKKEKTDKKWETWSDSSKQELEDWQKAAETAETDKEATYLKSIYSQWNQLRSSGKKEETENYMKSALKLFTTLSGLDKDVRTSVWDNIIKFGMNTKESINNIIESIKGNKNIKDTDKASLETLFNEIITAMPENLSLAVQSYADNLAQKWSDQSKILKKLTAGVDISEVDSVLNRAQELDLDDITIDSFIMDGDKLKLSNDAARTYWNTFFNKQDAMATKWATDFSEAYTALFSEDGELYNKNFDAMDTNLYRQLETVGVVMSEFVDYNELQNRYILKEGKTYEDIRNAAKEAAPATLENIKKLEKYNQWQREEITKSLNWEQGDYSSLKSIYKSFDIYKDLTDKNLTTAVNNRLAALISNTRRMSNEELDQPDIKNAIEKIRSAYNTYISDLVSKDLDTLYAQDYLQTGRGEEIIRHELIAAKNKTALEFASWIGSLAESAGQAITDQNDNFIKAFNKVYAQKSLNGVQDVQFLDKQHFAATSDQLKTFADTYQLSINEMVMNGLAWYNEAMGQWIVDYSALSTLGLDLSSIDGFKETVADGVNNFFKNLGNTIKNALTDSISNVEAKNLQEQVSHLGFEGELDFTKTADGLKLSEQSAIALYYTLKQIDTLQSQIVFDALSESLQKNNDHFASTTALLGHIRNISEEVYQADGKTSSARLAQYQAELQVAQDILAIRSTQEDSSLNFMSNKIPAAQNNPLNYAKNLTQAFQALRNAFNTGNVKKNGKAGFMDYEDWYNIVTEFNNMAAVSGKEIQLGSLTLKGDLESASKAIEAGAGALTAVDTGELKVNLTSVGIGIQSGAEALTSGINDGIQGVADAQVKALDGIIAMLELIVTMEQLGDIDVDGNGIDLSELFTVTINEGKEVKQFNGAYENWRKTMRDQLKLKEGDQGYNKDLQNALKGIKIGEFSIADIIEWDEAKFLGADESVQKAYMAVLSAFSKAALSGNYDLDNIQQSVLQVLAESGFEGTIPINIGNMTYVISSGVMTTIDWTNPDTDNIVTQLSRQYNNDKEKAKDQLVTWAQQYGNGEIKETTELAYVLALKKKVVIDNSGKIISATVGGKTYTANKDGQQVLNAAVNAAVLEDKGYTVTDQEIQAGATTKTGTVTVKTKIGDVVIDVESSGGETLLVGKYGRYHSQSEFLEKEWARVDRNDGWVDMNDPNSPRYATREAWEWGEYHIPVKVNPKFTLETNNGITEVNPAQDNTLRKELTNLMTGGREAIQQLITTASDHNNGTYTVSLPGDYKFTFTGGTDPAGALTQAIGEQLGIDVALSNTISMAIANAFASKNVQNSIGTALQQGFSKIGGEGSEPVSIPDLTVQPTNLHIDTSATNTSNLDTPMTVEDLTAIISKYDDTQAGKEKLLDKLVGHITSYDVTAEKPELEGLIQYINDINTEGADAALEAWRKQQETNGLKLSLEANTPETTTKTPQIGGVGHVMTTGISAEPFTAIANALSSISTDKIDALAEAAEQISPDKIITVKDSVNETRATQAVIAKEAINGINPGPATSAANALRNIHIQGQSVDATANITVQITHGSANVAGAAGNIGAFAKGNIALAGGTQTLMGELGPELVVSNGRYFLAGENGAEFVSLDKDAIVFNHKQTERLFAQGAVGSRGRPFTNEQNAISLAKGTPHTGPALVKVAQDPGGGGSGEQPLDKKNWSYQYHIKTSQGFVQGHLWGAPIATIDLPASAKGNVHSTGPAKASASAALAALKQLRAQWQALATLSAKDLAGKGGGGGGGGGKAKAFTKELERWYNLLQEIAQLEKEITYQETLRSKIQSDFTKNGKAYYNSQKDSIKALEKEIENHQTLAIQQENYFERRRKELNSDNNPYSSLYTFDENGQLKYKNGKFEELSQIVGVDKYNSPNMTPEEQYDYIINTLGIDERYFEYDNSGNKIDKKGKDWYITALTKFWDDIDSDKEEMQKLHDSIVEHQQAVLEAQQKENEYLRAMQDNQVELEENILNTVEDMRDRMIEEMEDEKDAYEDSAKKMIDGLTDALNKEKEMYERQEDQAETDRMRRRLAILLNSGGSASEILDLQQQLQQRDKDAYFEETQRQIDAIQDASDAEIERLEEQIELQKNILDYEKEHGLLWNEVYQVMNSKDPQGIAAWIVENNSEYWGKSPVSSAKDMDDLLFSSEQWTSYRDEITDDFNKLVKSILSNDGQKEWENLLVSLQDTYGKDFSTDEALKKLYIDKYLETSDPNESYKAIKEELDQRGIRTLADVEYANAKETTNLKGTTKKKTNKNYNQNYNKPTGTGAAAGNSLETRAMWYQTADGKFGVMPGIASAGSTIEAGAAATYALATSGMDVTNASEMRASTPIGAFLNTIDIRDQSHYYKEVAPNQWELTEQGKAEYKAYMLNAGKTEKDYASAHWGQANDYVTNGGILNVTKYDKNGKATTQTSTLALASDLSPYDPDNRVMGGLALLDQKETYSSYTAKQNPGYINQGKTLTVKNGNGTTTAHPGEGVYGKPGYVYDNQGKHVLASEWNKQNKNKVTSRDIGGYVDKTELELVHEGEAVFTAEQTKILKNNILSNKPNSLISLLKSYNEAYQGLSASTYDSIANHNEESIVIEHAEVNMNVAKIADDYDAKRAGEQALQEMLRIARKTSVTSVRR